MIALNDMTLEMVERLQQDNLALREEASVWSGLAASAADEIAIWKNDTLRNCEIANRETVRANSEKLRADSLSKENLVLQEATSKMQEEVRDMRKALLRTNQEALSLMSRVEASVLPPYEGRKSLRAGDPSDWYDLNFLRDEALRIATEHGFKGATFPEDIALIHSELSEALEDYRAGHGPNDFWYEEKKHFEVPSGGCPVVVHTRRREIQKWYDYKLVYKPCGIRSELADAMIRIAHVAGKHNIDLQVAVKEKMDYNETRPFKHGKVL